jgi:hypothetical protein
MLVCKNNKSVAICQSSFRNKLLYIFDSKDISIKARFFCQKKYGISKQIVFRLNLKIPRHNSKRKLQSMVK